LTIERKKGDTKSPLLKYTTYSANDYALIGMRRQNSSTWCSPLSKS